MKTFIDDTFTMPLGPVTVLAKFEPAEAPVITPKDAHVSAGEKATFTIQTPLDGLSYQWYIDRNNGRGWKMLDGATGTSYTTSRTEAKHNGYRYKCVAKDTEDYSAESNIAVLHVSSHPIPPTGDNNHTLLWAALAVFSVVALFCAGRKKRQYR